MSYYFLNNDEIDVFPTAKDRTKSLSNLSGGGRLLYEHIFSSIFSAVTDKKCYIVSYDDALNILEVMMNGYHFTLDLKSFINSLSAENCEFYLSLALKNDKTKEIAYITDDTNDTVADITDCYLGLKIFQVINKNELPKTDNDYTYYNLKVFDVIDKKIHICKDSYHRLNLQSLNISKIDGKHE